MQNEKLPLVVVLELTEISRSKLYRLVSKGLFPRPQKSANGWQNEGWLASDVHAWVMNRALSADLAFIGLAKVVDLVALYQSCPPEVAARLFPEMQQATLAASSLREVEA